MKSARMELVLIPSAQMDKWAQRNTNEHLKIRMSKKARLNYRPSEESNIYIRVHGSAAEEKLKLDAATKEDIKKHGFSKTETIGFVTSKTYAKLMGTANNDDKAMDKIWVSENTKSITVGADPEFVLTEPDGQGIYADTILGDQKWSNVGSDGPCAELRPDPSQEVGTLISNIESLLRNNTAIIQEYGWVGGATYRTSSMYRRFSIGGHIHFGLPSIPGAALDTDTILQLRIARVLDELVALPLVRIDTPMAYDRRRVSGYGKFADVRTGAYKFEWRVPSGLWLVNKELAHAVISVAKSVVEECWVKYENRDYNKNFMLNEAGIKATSMTIAFECGPTEQIRNLINNAENSSVSTELIRAIHGKLKNMSTYPLYKDEIKTFVGICCSDKMPLAPEKLELRESWIHNKGL